jgi:hypothetical protein
MWEDMLSMFTRYSLPWRYQPRQFRELRSQLNLTTLVFFRKEHFSMECSQKESSQGTAALAPSPHQTSILSVTAVFRDPNLSVRSSIFLSGRHY